MISSEFEVVKMTVAELRFSEDTQNSATTEFWFTDVSKAFCLRVNILLCILCY